MAVLQLADPAHHQKANGACPPRSAPIKIIPLLRIALRAAVNIIPLLLDELIRRLRTPCRH